MSAPGSSLYARLRLPPSISATFCSFRKTTTRMTSSSTILKLDPTPLSSIPTGPKLTDFVRGLIVESLYLIGKVTSPPQAPWHHHSQKGEVELFSRDVVITTGSDEEHWFARRSVHKIENWLGWKDWTVNLLDGHAENEAKYIPSLKKVDRIEAPELKLQDAEIEGYSDIRLDVYGIHHSLPFPLANRVFPVLLIRALAIETQEFLVISLPLIIPPETTNAEGQPVLGRTVLGRYAAVERCQVTEAGDVVEWLMATASDASGNLPMSIQRRSIPGAIAKDVPSFLGWMKRIN